jgi:GNAT superfamily N-acetyltransferase
MQNTNNTTIILEEYDSSIPEHKSQFAALNREWLTKYFYVEPFDEEIFADPEGRVLSKGGIILFARVDGQVVGTCSLLPLEAGCYEIAKMGVTERWQKHKIGEKLLLALMARAQQMKARKLYIVSSTRLENAIRLYRRHGFTDSPEIRHAHYARGNITLERNVA